MARALRRYQLVYEELNSVRVKIADTPEASEFTSIKQRIDEQQPSSVKKTTQLAGVKLTLKELLLKGDYLKDQVLYDYHEYIELVDWSGRIVRERKRGAIDERLPPILSRLGIDSDHWYKAMQSKGVHQFSRAMGCKEKLREHAKKLNILWIKGIDFSGKLFPT
ncbi:MAG: hypothetical protein V7784_03015 [Oceanospirillaceae bacterium]